MPDKAARALRRFCLDCQGGHPPSVSACADTACLLYPWRRYRVPPARSGTGTKTCPAAPLPGLEGLPGDPGKRRESLSPEQAIVQDDTPAGDAPVRAIRRFCLACAGSRREVRECDAKEACPLWSYRFGVLPSTFKRVVARMKRKRMELTLPGLPQ